MWLFRDIVARHKAAKTPCIQHPFISAPLLHPVLRQIQRWIGGKAECETCAIRKGRVGSHSVCPFFPHNRPTAFPPILHRRLAVKTRRNTAKCKDAACHTRFTSPQIQKPGVSLPVSPGFCGVYLLGFVSSARRRRLPTSRQLFASSRQSQPDASIPSGFFFTSRIAGRRIRPHVFTECLIGV
jgi:hypothetical protein